MIINPSFGGTNFDGVKMSSAVIPKGRMRGDVDGDGRITSADADLINAFYYGQGSLDDVARWCADLNADDLVDTRDYSIVNRYLKGTGTIDFADYYGNWTYVNPFWTTDISIPGLTSSHSIVVIVSGEWDKGMFYNVEFVEGVLRIYSNFPPTSDTPCAILYGEGDGTVMIQANASPTADDIGAAKKPIMVTASLSFEGWDASTNEQEISVPGVVSSSYGSQILQFIPVSSSAVDFTRCGVCCVRRSNDLLTFHAETIPSKKISMYVAITNLA